MNYDLGVTKSTNEGQNVAHRIFWGKKGERKSRKRSLAFLNDKECGPEKDSTVDRALALHTTNSCLVLSIPYCSRNSSGDSSVCIAQCKLRALPYVAPNKSKFKKINIKE